MSETGLTYLLWSDLTGITRTRGVPSRLLARRAEAGLGWAMATQALNPFADIMDNPFGPMDEARQVPVMDTRFSIPGDDENPAIEAVLCNSMLGDLETPWDCCVRAVCTDALARLEAATGRSLTLGFEHEFTLSGDGQAPETPFSFAAARQRHAFLGDLQRLLDGAGVPVETLEPEYGLGQYELGTAPMPAIAAADTAVITREVVREAARRHGLRASFSPKIAADAVGNGTHLHFSLTDAAGRNVTSDPDGPMMLDPVAAALSAGILAHLDALVALTAPAPVSYYRLGPHHWSCGFRAIGVQNREAALRIIPGVARDPVARAQGFNIEFRALDSIASPYLAVGALVRAALEGLSGGATLPPAAEKDPADMDAAERAALGITALPATLGAALDALEADAAARGWLPERMLTVYRAIKRWEADFAEKDPDAVYARYARTY